jgi:fructose-1,6-bisphosphatase/inositol monophosphatase family enzyme
MKPYDFLALVPIVQGAGGAITNWRVRCFRFWEVSARPGLSLAGLSCCAPAAWP